MSSSNAPRARSKAPRRFHVHALRPGATVRPDCTPPHFHLEPLDGRVLLCALHSAPGEPGPAFGPAASSNATLAVGASSDPAAAPVSLANVASAPVTFDVSFADPGGNYAAYYDAIRATVVAAGSEWARLMVPSGTPSIQIEVRFDPFVGTANGGARGLTYLGKTPSGADLWEQGPAGEIRTGVDPNAAEVDGVITFGDGYLRNQLWFDPDPAARTATIPANRVDAYSVVLHELGHVFAYNGWRNWTTGQLPGNYLSTFDQRAVESNGTYFFDGPAVRAAYGGPAALTYGNMMHWGNNSPRPGADLIPQLMNGVVYYYSTRYEIGSLDAAVLRDIGVPVENTAPTVAEKKFELAAAAPAFSFRFSESVRASLSLADLTVRNLTTGQVVPSSAITMTYDRATDRARFAFAGALADGNYRATLAASGMTDLAGNRPAADLTLDFHSLAGDADGNRLVNFDDLLILASNYNKAGRTYAQGDFNFTGTVNFDDLLILASNYNKALAAPLASAAPAFATAAAAPTDAADEQDRPNKSLFSTQPIAKPAPVKAKPNGHAASRRA